LRPQLAGKRPVFPQQLLVVLLRRCQRLRLAAVRFVRKESAVDFPPALQPHKEAVGALFRLVNSRNAFASFVSVHHAPENNQHRQISQGEFVLAGFWK